MLTPFEKLLVAHLVGDWILAQTNWEAQNKAKDWWACWSHAFKWTVAMFLGVYWALDWQTPLPFVAWLTVVAMGALHAVIDRRWPVLWLMRTKEYLPLGDPLMGGPSPLTMNPPFWLIICLDQVLHIVQVAVIASVL